VRGKLEFTDYTHKDLGTIEASVLTDQSYPTMDRGGGSVTLYLSIGSWKHSASITWDLKQFEPRYFVDSTEIERKAFEELFSSFELIKIMDNSFKMR